MLHTHDLADNLFARLEISKPHAKQTPRENFCTEALVWCLRNVAPFRSAFVNKSASRLKSQIPSDQLPEISSQVSARTAKDITGRKRVQYDFELAFTKSRIVIEAKVDSAVDGAQLQLYTKLLKREKTRSSLLLVLSDAKKIPADTPRVPTPYWEEIHELVIGCIADKRSGRGLSRAAYFVLGQFANFLESLGFLTVEIKLSSDTAASAAEVTAFLTAFQDLLLKLKSNAELEASHQTPMLERDEKKKISWFGLHLTSSRYKEGWVGLELCRNERPTLLFEALFQRPVALPRHRLNGKAEKKSETAGTRVQVRKELEQGAVSTATVTQWITTTATEFYNLGRRSKKRIASRTT